jgi:hypothetical protein
VDDYYLEEVTDSESDYYLEEVEEPTTWDKVKDFGAGLAHTTRAMAETGAALVTGMAAFPISKGTKWIEYGLSGGDLEQAKAAEQRANERIQFQPTTKEAQGAMEQVSKYVLDPVFGTLREAGQLIQPWKRSEAAKEFAGDITEIGGPFAIAKGLKGLRGSKEIAKERIAPEELKTEPILERPVEIPVERAKEAKQFETGDYYLEPIELKAEPLSTTSGKKVEPVITPEALEPLVKGGATGELPKYAEGSSINLERLDTTQDVKQFQRIMTEAAEKEIGKKKVSWEETTKAAEELAWDDKAFLKASKKQGGFSAAEIDAMRQINTNSLTDLFKTIKEMPEDLMQRTPESRLAVLDKLNNYVEVMKATSQKSSEAGRALNIHKKMIQENPEFTQDAYRQQVLKQMTDALGGKEMTDQMINDLKKVDFKDPKSVRDIIQKYHKSGLFDKFYEVWLNSILSAPASHAANILGNTITLATKIPETAISQITAGKSPMGALRAETVGAWQGMKEGIRAAVKAFDTGVPSDMLTKVEHQRYAAIPGKTGEAIRIPTRALTAADEFFKSIVYRSETNLQAYKIANSEGLKGNKLAERMSEIINDPLNPQFREVHTAARNESLYRTFNKPLGKMGQHVMSLRDEVPGMRYVIPFIRTPMNIAKFALERTPLNFGKILYDYKTGKINASELNAELAKPIVGSLLSAATVMGVLDGGITGAPPKNKKDRDLLYATGWQPYSLKIGGKYVSYNRLEPVGSVVGMSADFVNAMRDDDSQLNEKAGNIIMSFSRNIASKTFLQGISGVLDAISDPERYGGNYMEKLSGSVVPSIVAAGARAVDPFVREVETPLEAIQARIPFASKNLPTKVGAFQMPIERPGGTLSRFLSPVSISEEKPDMAIIAGAEIDQRKRERSLTRLQKKTLKELLRESRR